MPGLVLSLGRDDVLTLQPAEWNKAASPAHVTTQNLSGQLCAMSGSLAKPGKKRPVVLCAGSGHIDGCAVLALHVLGAPGPQQGW